MTSVFEVLPTKGILQTEEMTLDTSQNEHKETIARIKKKDESISRRCFLICQTCFKLPYKACPTCNDNRIESLPISYDERYHFEYTATMRVVV
ncbi:MAG: hypothetical protein WAM14_06230 [Candidatus Nitrosopolaris sp.]